MKKLVKIFKTFYSAYLRCPDGEKFDTDFRVILEIFHFLGFYQPVTSKKSILYGAFMFTFTLICYFFGALKDVVLSYYNNNISMMITSAVSLPLALAMINQVLKFIANRAKIIELMTDLQAIHEDKDKNFIQKYRKTSLLLIKAYHCFLTIGSLAIIIARLCGIRTFKLFIPTIFDGLANGSFYNTMLFMNLIQTLLLGEVFLTCDLFHILCMIKIEANLKLLNAKLRNCADRNEAADNEMELIACVRYHVAIIE